MLSDTPAVDNRGAAGRQQTFQWAMRPLTLAVQVGFPSVNPTYHPFPLLPEHAPSSEEHIHFFFGDAPTRADRGCTRYCQARTSRSLEKHRDCLPSRSARRNQCVLAVLASQPAQESRAQLSRYGLCCDLAHSGRQQKRLPLQSRLQRGRWPVVRAARLAPIGSSRCDSAAGRAEGMPERERAAQRVEALEWH